MLYGSLPPSILREEEEEENISLREREDADTAGKFLFVTKSKFSSTIVVAGILEGGDSSTQEGEPIMFLTTFEAPPPPALLPLIFRLASILCGKASILVIQKP